MLSQLRFIYLKILRLEQSYLDLKVAQPHEVSS